MSRIEELRTTIGATAFNQKELKDILERRKRVFGSENRKARKSAERRDQDERFAQDWINQQSELKLSPEQRLKLALKRGNDEDVEFIFDHLDDVGRFGFRVDTFTSPEPASTDDARIA